MSHLFSKSSTLLTAGFLAAGSLGGSAQAAISGFGAFGTGATDYTRNVGPCCSGASPSISGGVLGVTSGGYTGGTAFYNTTQDVSAFHATFTANVTGTATSGAGFTFIVQDSPHGATANGNGNEAWGYGSVGYNGSSQGHITPSTAVYFNERSGGIGVDTTATGGLAGTVPTGISILGTPFDVTLDYNGTTLTTTLTQGSNTYTETDTVNIPTVLGASTAYVGFTGGTQGGGNITTQISNFTFSNPISTPEPASLGLLGLGGVILAKRRRTA